MADLKLNTNNGSVTLKPEDGSGNVDVTIPRAGVGKLLQVVQGTNDILTVTTSGTEYHSTGLSVSLTRKSNDSKFKVLASGPLNARPANNGAGIAIKAKVNSGTFNFFGLQSGSYISGGFMYSNSALDLWGQAVAQAYDDVASNIGDTITFEIYVTAQGPGADGSTTCRFGHDGQDAVIIVEEIAN